MGKDQHTSGTIVEPVTEGQSDLLVMATKNYPGGKEKLERAKGHTNFQPRLWELLDVLAGERVLQLPILERPIWKPIKLGTGLKNRNDFVEAIEKAGGRVSNWANELLCRPGFTVSQNQIDVNLVIVTGSDLGFTKPAPRKDIYEEALSLGFELCSSEVGPQLRLQYMDQPKGEWLLIAMEPIVGSDGNPGIFNVGHDGGDLWLNYNYYNPGHLCFPGFRWVFVRK